MATTAEHVRDCQRCYEILVRGVGKKVDEIIAAKLAEGITSAQIQNSMILAGHPPLIPPSKLWPLLSELYSAFVTCEHWPKIDVPN
jgi:hypothetical protein